MGWNWVETSITDEDFRDVKWPGKDIEKRANDLWNGMVKGYD